MTMSTCWPLASGRTVSPSAVAFSSYHWPASSTKPFTRSTRPQPETAAPRYLLKDSGGHVALYTADGIGPLATYDDLYTRLLPESDVLALQQGVFVADEAELQRRLEDYGL